MDERFSHELKKEEKEYLEKVKQAVEEKLSDILNDIFAPFNFIVSKTYIKDEAGNFVLDKNGNPIQDWGNISLTDIKTILLKIPVIQLRLSSIEMDSWAEAEFAKLAKEEAFERVYGDQKSGTEGVKKNIAYLQTIEDNYRAFFLKYANKRIQGLNDSLTRITDKWSRVIELLKLEANIK